MSFRDKGKPSSPQPRGGPPPQKAYKPVLVNCPKCYGEGYIETRNYNFPITENETCKGCGGIGVVRVNLHDIPYFGGVKDDG